VLAFACGNSSGAGPRVQGPGGRGGDGAVAGEGGESGKGTAGQASMGGRPQTGGAGGSEAGASDAGAGGAGDIPVRGVVVDLDTGRPLPNRTVSVHDESAATDAAGTFALHARTIPFDVVVTEPDGAAISVYRGVTSGALTLVHSPSGDAPAPEKSADLQGNLVGGGAYPLAEREGVTVHFLSAEAEGSLVVPATLGPDFGPMRVAWDHGDLREPHGRRRGVRGRRSMRVRPRLWSRNPADLRARVRGRRAVHVGRGLSRDERRVLRHGARSVRGRFVLRRNGAMRLPERSLLPRPGRVPWRGPDAANVRRLRAPRRGRRHLRPHARRYVPSARALRRGRLRRTAAGDHLSGLGGVPSFREEGFGAAPADVLGLRPASAGPSRL
jgi:hypothetical protein